jgi:hypothetical protein
MAVFRRPLHSRRATEEYPMCGIIGYTGARVCKPFLIGGL